MDRMLYISMNAAQQTMLAQAANSNNLANVNTTGFRADFEQFRSQPVLNGHQRYGACFRRSGRCRAPVSAN